MNRFENKTVIVTGSGSGIGAATARLFSQEGANVVLNGRTREKLDKVAADLDKDRTLIVEADIGTRDGAKRLIDDTLSTFGRIDCLVNNAGTAVMGGIEDVAEDDFENLMRINVTGNYLCTKYAWKALKASKGNVVNTSSVSGIGGDWGMFAYNATKGAITNMTRALALDYASSGVRVNAVNPSFTKTDLTEGIQENKALVDAFMKRIPEGRPGEPEDVAKAIVFLASDDAGFVNGVNLPVDGGLSASNGQPAQI